MTSVPVSARVSRAPSVLFHARPVASTPIRRRQGDAAPHRVRSAGSGRLASSWLGLGMLLVLTVALVLDGVLPGTAGAGQALTGWALVVRTGLQGGLLAGLLVMWSQMRRLQARQAQDAGLARSDELTGLPNRRALNEQLQALLGGRSPVSRAQPGSGSGPHPWSVLLIDIDHFKAVNDTCGHQAGDEVLRAVCQSLRQELRGEDLLGRWGGEEFLALLPNTGFEGALVAAERLRRAVSLRSFPYVGTVTVSIGVATRVAGDTLERVVSRADAGMYLAKRGGRNRVAFTQ